MVSLENQVAIVTGAGRGIGRAVAVELGRLGMRVALVARTRSELEETAGAVPGSMVFPADLRVESEVQHVVEATEGKLGAIDVLVNAAGVYHFGPVTETSEDDFDRVVNTNLKGIFLTCRSVLPHMTKRKRGQIINIASIAGKAGSAGRALYCASKFGVVGFTESLYQEVREHGVRVSLICPGSTNTTFSPKESKGKARDRMLQPEDVAHAVRMLLGQEANSFISEVVMRPTMKS
jgi:3-oxoacyl-[acyl-carrier protein] reductase